MYNVYYINTLENLVAPTEEETIRKMGDAEYMNKAHCLTFDHLSTAEKEAAVYAFLYGSSMLVCRNDESPEVCRIYADDVEINEEQFGLRSVKE